MCITKTWRGWQSGHAADCNSVYAGSIPDLRLQSCKARVVKSVDTGDLKSPRPQSVPVRVWPRAPVLILVKMVQ